MAATTTYGLRYLTSADPPALHTGTQNLAEDVDAAMRTPAAQLYATTAQSIPNNTFTAVNFGGETVDTHNGHSLTSNNSRWTCPAGWGGYYLVSGVAYLENITGPVCAAILLSGSDYVNGSLTRTYAGPSGIDIGAATSPVVVQLAPGDYVQLMVEQNSSATRSTFSDGFKFCSGLSVACLRKA